MVYAHYAAVVAIVCWWWFIGFVCGMMMMMMNLRVDPREYHTHGIMKTLCVQSGQLQRIRKTVPKTLHHATTKRIAHRVSSEGNQIIQADDTWNARRCDSLTPHISRRRLQQEEEAVNGMIAGAGAMREKHFAAFLSVPFVSGDGETRYFGASGCWAEVVDASLFSWVRNIEHGVSKVGLIIKLYTQQCSKQSWCTGCAREVLVLT